MQVSNFTANGPVSTALSWREALVNRDGYTSSSTVSTKAPPATNKIKDLVEIGEIGRKPG